MAKRRPSKKNSGRTTRSKSKGNGQPRKRSAKNGEADKTLFDDLSTEQLSVVPLRLAAQTRYLNYSLSVITSRALPDVRDGLKPVQRRILYTMDQQKLGHTAKHRKCAKVVGDVMGNYHPHGDSSIYDALVRMAQPFSLRMPLVDGSGNFGSIDGDNAAAMRYTECRLTRIAGEILEDLGTRTVAFKPNYDGSREEPVVLPSRVPNLLVNGATGIAVGMATNIPPHNLKEVCHALLKLLKDPEIKEYQLVANDAVKGPDFPTGGQIINTKEELREIYATGQGAIKLRGTWKLVGGAKSAGRICRSLDSVRRQQSQPGRTDFGIGVQRQAAVGNRGSRSVDRRHSRRPGSEKGADEDKVLAYLYKNTPLQTNFNVNMTCLVPTENPEVGAPDRLGLKEILWHFLHFRLEVVTKRLENELATLSKRIHILHGFVMIFDALDEIIRIIRRSDGKADAAEKIMKRFPVKSGKSGKTTGLDEEQTDAILELKLYRLARLEINLILEELKKKEKRAREIRKLLEEDTADTNASGRWKIVRAEIESLIKDFCRMMPRNDARSSRRSDRKKNTRQKILSSPKTVMC